MDLWAGWGRAVQCKLKTELIVCFLIACSLEVVREPFHSQETSRGLPTHLASFQHCVLLTRLFGELAI